MSAHRTELKTWKNAVELRNNLTEGEKILWSQLCNHQIQQTHFRRQHPIGRYVVDFCAPRKKLIIEIDGEPHKAQIEYDLERTIFLQSRGFRVLRFWESDVTNHLDEVLIKINDALGQNPG